MKRYTIEVSEAIYQLLNRQATHQNSSLEKVIERLLVVAPSALPEDSNTNPQEALAAVQRLTTLFADVKIKNLEEVLADPMIELANTDLNLGLL